MTNELEVLGLFLEEYDKAKEKIRAERMMKRELIKMNDIYIVGEKTSIHVFEGDKLVDIYTKETGVPKFVEMDIQTEAESRDKVKINIDMNDGDILDKDWARDRNREIETEVDILREQISILTTYYSDKGEHIEAIEDLIKDLLEERDKNTFKYGLAGEKFNRLYKEKNGVDTDGDFVFSDEELTNTRLLVRDYSHKPNGNEARFKKITKEMVELYSRKNTDYGGSFDQSLDEDGLLVAKIKFKDKLNRFSQLIDNEALVYDETMRDTLIDLGNYAIMTLMWLDENATD